MHRGDGSTRIAEADEIYLPNVETLGTASLSTSGSVKELNLPKVTFLGEAVFEGTYKLKKLSIPSFSGDLPRYTFMSSGIESFNNDNIQSVGDYAFQRSNVTSIILKEATYIGEKTFENCKSLKLVYLPKVTETGVHSFHYLEQAVLSFLPSLVLAQDLALENENSIVFLSEKFTNYQLSCVKEQNCTIIAPKGSYAEDFSITGLQTQQFDNNMKFINSDSMATANGYYQVKGKTHYDFCLENMGDILELADNIDCRFTVNGEEVSAEGGAHKGDNLYLSFTAPDSTDITSLRACINIDGMEFKSPELTELGEATAVDVETNPRTNIFVCLYNVTDICDKKNSLLYLIVAHIFFMGSKWNFILHYSKQFIMLIILCYIFNA